MSKSVSPQAPDALLLLSRSCPYCPAVLENLSALVKSGELGRLEVVNLELHPEVAEQFAVRSVPWIRLGEFELQGQQSLSELRRWISRHGSRQGQIDFLAGLLAVGELNRALQYVEKNPHVLEGVPQLLADEDTELNVRVGIGALLEHLQDQPALKPLVAPLGSLCEHREARVRNDACHFLGLTGDPDAIPFLKTRLDDPDAGVREVAEESLADLQQRLQA